MSTYQEMDYAQAEAMVAVAAEVRRERYAQHRKWGVQDLPDGEWLAVLTEEVGEAASALLRHRSATPNMHRRTDTLREELIQIAAVAVAWVEAIDRRGAE